MCYWPQELERLYIEDEEARLLSILASPFAFNENYTLKLILLLTSFSLEERSLPALPAVLNVLSTGAKDAGIERIVLAAQ